MTKEELVGFLQADNVPLKRWGTGEAKSVDHLLEEINSGESTLEERDGVLFRTAMGTVITVYYQDDTRRLTLKEDRQVFKDGRERKRAVAGSIGEKLKFGENALSAAYRALQEELSISEKLPLTSKPSEVKGPNPSQSFPGIMTTYMIHVYEVYLPQDLYKPEGYVETQRDKTNYYVWVTTP